MNKKIIFSLLIALVAAFGAKAETYEITAGGLRAQLPEDPSGITTLTLGGTMNAEDFETICEMLPALQALDIQDVTIESLTSVKPLLGSGYSFRANELPAGALFGKKLNTLLLPESITSIGQNSLAGNSFTAFQIPEGVTIIGDYALYGCEQLTSITLPSSIESIGAYAFAGCTAMTRFDISATSVKELSQCLLSGDAALTSVMLPSTLTNIGYGALMGTTALKSISIPGSVTEIGDRAFAYSGLESLSVPSSVKSVGNFAFAHCMDLTEIRFHDLTEMGVGVFFYDPALVSLDLSKFHAMPDFIFTGAGALNLASSDLSNIERVGDYALKDNPSEKLVFSNHLSEVGTHAMENMSNLTEINVAALKDNVPETAEDAFAGLDQHNIKLGVAEGYTDTWNATDQWKEFNIQAVTSIAIVDDGNPEAIKAWISNGQLNVAAPDNITDLNIYDIDGTQIAAMRPGSTQVQHDITGWNARVYIVNVKTPKAARTFKLMR